MDRNTLLATLSAMLPDAPTEAILKAVACVFELQDLDGWELHYDRSRPPALVSSCAGVAITVDETDGEFNVALEEETSIFSVSPKALNYLAKVHATHMEEDK